MKEYSAEKIRNLGFFGHASSGKTSLCEALLLAMKQNTRLGSVAEGTSLLDYDEDEISRKIFIAVAIVLVVAGTGGLPGPCSGSSGSRRGG